MVFLGRFLYFLYHWNQEKILYTYDTEFFTSPSQCLHPTWWNLGCIKQQIWRQ